MDFVACPATSAPGLGSHLPCHICTGTGLAPATSAPALGSPLPTSAPALGSPLPPILIHEAVSLEGESTSGSFNTAKLNTKPSRNFTSVLSVVQVRSARPWLFRWRLLHCPSHKSCLSEIQVPFATRSPSEHSSGYLPVLTQPGARATLACAMPSLSCVSFASLGECFGIFAVECIEEFDHDSMIYKSDWRRPESPGPTC